MSSRIRSAMSLLEMMVAMTIFASVMIIVTETAIGANQTFDQGMAQDDIAFDTSVVLRQMRADMVRSGWHIPLDQIPSGTLPATALEDRTIRYFPYIQSAAALGSGFKHTWRSGSLTDMNLPATILPGTPADASIPFAGSQADYYNSFHAPSQEMIFVRANLGSWAAEPWKNKRQEKQFNFSGTLADWKTGNHWITDTNGIRISPPPGGKRDDLGVLRPSGYVETAIPGVYTEVDPGVPYGAVLTSGTIDNRGQLVVTPYWETMTLPTYGFTTTAGVKTFTGMGANDSDIREYMYCVVPVDIGAGLGRLVRAVRMPLATGYPVGVEVGNRIALDPVTNSGMIVEKVLSDDVVRIVFDTCRTTVDDPLTTDVNEQLDLNQVRVRLFFARKLPTTDRVITQVIETVISMHAKLGQVWQTTDTSLLGGDRIPLPR